MTPRRSVEAELATGLDKVVVQCMAILGGHDVDKALLRIIGGAGAGSVLEGREGGCRRLLDEDEDEGGASLALRLLSLVGNQTFPASPQIACAQVAKCATAADADGHRTAPGGSVDRDC